MGDIFGSFRRDTGGAAETCEVQDTRLPVQPSCQEAKEGSRTYWPNAWDPASHSTATPQEG